MTGGWGRRETYLECSPGLQRRRARVVLDLESLHHLAGGRRWVTTEEYARVRLDREWNEEAAKKSLQRLRAELRGAGINLRYGVDQDDQEYRARKIHVGTPELRELVELHLHAAREVDELARAGSEGRAPELEALAAEAGLLAPASIRIEYCDRSKSLRWIARKHGTNKDHVRRVLLVSRGALRPPRVRLTVEQTRPRETVEQALEAYRDDLIIDGLRGLVLVASLLSCSLRTAARFLRRSGVSVRPCEPPPTVEE